MSHVQNLFKKNHDQQRPTKNEMTIAIKLIWTNLKKNLKNKKNETIKKKTEWNKDLTKKPLLKITLNKKLKKK